MRTTVYPQVSVAAHYTKHNIAVELGRQWPTCDVEGGVNRLTLVASRPGLNCSVGRRPVDIRFFENGGRECWRGQQSKKKGFGD